MQVVSAKAKVAEEPLYARGSLAGARDRRLKNPNPVVMTATVSKTSSEQLWARLLCTECEERFNKNGETYVLSWLSPKGIAQGTFPLVDRLKVALPIFRTPLLDVYAGENIGVDTERFAYFAVSILWRASVQRWRMPDGRLTTEIVIGDLEDEIRRYLLREAEFPADLAVVFTVSSDSESRCAFYPPAVCQNQVVFTYGLLVQGIHFRIFTGPNIPDEVRNVCCVRSPQHFIFLRDCSRDTFQSFATLASTTRPVPALGR
jgi:hypothetical protein